jgi:hypothetical protein
MAQMTLSMPLIVVPPLPLLVFLTLPLQGNLGLEVNTTGGEVNKTITFADFSTLKY